MAKFYIKIASIVLLFAGCVAAGYFIVPATPTNTEIGGGGEPTVPEPIDPPIQDTTDVVVVVPDTLSLPPVRPPQPDPQPDPQPVEVEPAVSSKPEITNVWIRPLEQTPASHANKIGKSIAVTAKTESGDQLRYEITTSSGRKYSSATGKFADVYPTDDGKFTIVVTNTRTGEKAECEKGGLLKNLKLTVVQVESQLNGSLGKYFYFYFDKNVKFKCTGSAVSAENMPTTLNALLQVTGMGYSADVKDNTIEYNEWNRITYFEVELN